MGAKDWAKNKGQSFGEEIKEFGDYPTMDRYLNRNTEKYKDKPYLGQGNSNYNFNGASQGNNLGLYTDRQNESIGPGKRVGEDQGYYGMGGRYDMSRMPNNLSFNTGANNINNQGIINTDAFNNLGTNNMSIEEQNQWFGGP